METSQTSESKQTRDVSGAPVKIDVSFVSGDAFDEDCHARMKWLRDNEPVFWSEVDKIWVVTRYDDVQYVSKHQELFTSAKGVRPGNVVKFGLIDEDEPRHMNLRKLINKGFSPRMVRRLEQEFEKHVKRTLDKVASTGACNFVDDIAVPLPLLMIGDMLGIESKDFERFHGWSDAMIAAEGNLEDEEVMGKAAVAFMEYSAHLQAIIADRKATPQDDLISILSGADASGILGTLDSDVDSLAGNKGAEHEALVTNELMMLLVVLMVAGNETTRNAISGGMQLLIENPEARKRLVEDPSLIPAAIEEMLRLTSPVRSFSRTVVEDVEFGGKKMKKDDVVLIVYGSANRDSREFDSPETFDIDRNPTHLAFGIGAHFCLGASLARMEMRMTFTELLRRLPDMEYAEDGPTLETNPLVRTCSKMLVKYSPEKAAS